ncbi:DUF1772-domain-containing protein [Penicillium frequentans]|uniref:DUF1772-domain-containing protein n=1 Tax=Penicillium frequentans TaxID=3151616 RepID=A0AAD6D5P2_9EURO|nr:DUF1772-domain-containing protein [Penicillium glabrum]
MTSQLLGFHMAQAIGISGAAWLSGMKHCFDKHNYRTCTGSIPKRRPQVPESPSKAMESPLRDRKKKAPPIAVAVASSLTYLAWSVRQGGPLYKTTVYSRSGLYLAAAVLTIGIVPYTLIFMVGTNNALMKKAESTSDADKEVPDLIERWKTLNLGRSIFPLAGAICAVVATIL